MSYTVVDVDQRTDAWYDARIAMLTASHADAMLARPKKNGDEPVGKTELRLRLALEAVRHVSLDRDGYESPYMRLGREREVEGLAVYEAVTGEITQRVGFIKHDLLPIGCSPDAIVGDFDGGVELKCPKFTTHWAYLRENRLPPEYAPQVIHSLFVTGLPWWDFCSYCPEFDDVAPLFRIRVWSTDVDLDAYALALTLFLGEVEAVKASLRSINDGRAEMSDAQRPE